MQTYFKHLPTTPNLLAIFKVTNRVKNMKFSFFIILNDNKNAVRQGKAG